MAVTLSLSLSAQAAKAMILSLLSSFKCLVLLKVKRERNKNTTLVDIVMLTSGFNNKSLFLLRSHLCLFKVFKKELMEGRKEGRSVGIIIQYKM